jgi:PPK2 family polyphosphate:nucleotide phosphotransferase
VAFLVMKGPEERHRVPPGAKVRLRDHDPRDTSGFKGSKDDAVAETRALGQDLQKLQELLWADHRHRILLVLQGLDTSGKDGTVSHVFDGVNPQGVRVAKFGPPSPVELAHDFLWRVYPELPESGEIAIFNRSHYEDVLIVRVDHLAPRDVWSRRYHEINEFERTVVDEGTTVVKFFLPISRKEQTKRLQERLNDPTKHWKFSASDMTERRNWNQYTPAIEEMLERTSTPWAPWYLVPSDRKWYRDLVVSRVLVRTLKDLKLRWPKLPEEFTSTTIR